MRTTSATQFLGLMGCALVLTACRKDEPEPVPPPQPVAVVPAGLVHDTIIDIDGNHYLTVLIGSQEWMAENLRTSRYRDGSIIPVVTDDLAWGITFAHACCSYDNDPANDATLGKLYNWYAATHPEICPAGWHVPTDAEWTQLADALGGSAVAGGRMKASPLWNAPNTGATNESGFSGLPVWRRWWWTGHFAPLGLQGRWWSVTQNGSYTAWYRSLSHTDSVLFRSQDETRDGYCVRCLKD